MRSNQWYVLSFTFIVLMIWFFQQDSTYERLCGAAGLPPAHYTAEEWLEKGSEPVSRVELWCINTEIFDPFIYLFGVMGIVCSINGWLESRAEKRRR